MGYRRIECMSPIQYMHGKLGKKSISLVGGRGGFIGTSRRYSATNYFAFKNQGRTSAYSASELGYMQKFGQAAKNAAAALKDPTQIPTITAGFKAQTKYKTLFTYAWRLEYDKL